MQSPHITLIIGLGNKGNEYKDTRHNAGVWWIHRMAELHYVSFNKNLNAHVATVNTQNNHKIRLVTFDTYMNTSGIHVASILKYYQATAANMLIVHDELNLQPGQIAFKMGGGHAGHNGLRDIMLHVPGEFARLRIGIGHPGDKEQVSNYVLSRPSIDEKKLITEKIEKSVLHENDLINLNIETIKRILNGI